nr:hypothetical protein [uncultured Sphingomonas sp.]
MEQRPNLQKWAIGVLMAIGAGYLGATLIGPALWLPLLGAGLIYAGLRYGMGRDRSVSLTIAALAGHTLWIVWGALGVPGALPLVGVDVVLNAFLMLWLLVRPGYAVAAMVILYQLFGLFGTIATVQGAWELDQGKMVHIAVRLLIIASALGVIRHAYYQSNATSGAAK